MATHKRPTASIEPLFRFGALIYSAGIHALTRTGALDPLPYLRRHLCGDWGDMSEDDLRDNDAAAIYGTRLLSSYQIAPGQKIWIITEADRSMTTILFPDEFSSIVKQ